MRAPSSTPSLRRAPGRQASVPRRRGEQGFSLLMAIGLIAFISAAVVISLRAVASESALQAQERRNREAFFAAEAGMAEGREVVRLNLTAGSNFASVISALTAQNETGLPSTASNPWYEVIPWTNYTLQSASSDAAIDSDITTANQELTGPDGLRIEEFPDASNVFYRVFLVDDDDGDSARNSDSNNRVWLISVGEVRGRSGQPQRVIIRSLVTSGTGVGNGTTGGDKGGDENMTIDG